MYADADMYKANYISQSVLRKQIDKSPFLWLSGQRRHDQIKGSLIICMTIASTQTVTIDHNVVTARILSLVL